jgi:glycosyltransferase involved in cell wall biosynthesis
LARLLGRLTSRRVVFDPLASRYETKILDWGRKPEGSPSARWNRGIDRWAFRSSDLLIADTRAHKEYYGRDFGLDPLKVGVVPVGFDDRVFSAALRKIRPADGAPFTVLFFGSFLPLHGVTDVIEAARLVFEADPSVRFHFVGAGQTLSSVQARAAGLGLSNIHFEGWLSQKDLAETAARLADVCLGIFGRTEKAARVVPHKVFQAMALGKPVVTARTPAVEELFIDRENVLFCGREYPLTLAAAILELKRDRALRETIAQRGQDLVWQKYHPAALGAVLRDFLIAANGGSSR